MASKKLSKQTRDDLQKVFDDVGTEKLKKWIDEVGKKNPGRAAELMLALAEYCAPKLARVEQSGGLDSQLRVIVRQEKS